MISDTNSYFYPVFEEDRFDYIDTTIYEVELVTDNSYGIQQSEDNLVLKYTLKGNNLLTQLFNKKEIKFVCTTVVKSTMYRESISEYKVVNDSNPIEVIQIVPLQDTKEIQQFSPMIVYIGDDKEIELKSSEMGLDEFWDNKKVTLYKGAILAKDGWRETEYSASDLLCIKLDENLDYSFRIVIETKEGGRFLVHTCKTLFESMNKKRNAEQKAHFNSIATHMLCVGFMKLKDDFKDGSDDLTNFNAIKRKLQSENMPTWEDPDFDPNRTACHFLPHILTTEDGEYE